MADFDSPTDEIELVLAIASGTSVRDAAAHAGMSERTVYRRLNDDDFRQQVAEARREMFSQALGKMACAASDAVSTLHDLTRQAESESVRASAAKAILNAGNRWRETDDLEERMLELERQLVNVKKTKAQ